MLKPQSVNIPIELIDRCRNEHINMSALVRHLLVQHFKRRGVIALAEEQMYEEQMQEQIEAEMHKGGSAS